jgi:hypothetical protein
MKNSNRAMKWASLQKMKDWCDRRMQALDSPMKAPNRVVDVEIIKTGLVHTFDLDSSAGESKVSFQVTHRLERTQNIHGTLLPLGTVQWNGLLHELRSRLLQSGEYDCAMILCPEGEMPLVSGQSVFSQSIDFKEEIKGGHVHGCDGPPNWDTKTSLWFLNLLV